MTKLDEFKQVCRRYLYLREDEFIDVIFGAVFANRLDSKPVWLYLIAPPGSGKTEILQALSGNEEVENLSQLTPQTLLSGKIHSKRESDPSLIPKLDGKVLVVKDLTALMGRRYEEVSAIMATLRDAYDGTCRNRYGTGKDAYYKSKFGVIAGVTDVIDRHRGLLSALGERFLSYRCPDLTEEEITLRCLKAGRTGELLEVTSQEEDIKRAAKGVLRVDTRGKHVEFPFTLKQRIVEAAFFVSRARCRVERDRNTREPEMAVPEIPTRLTKQLIDLAVGITQAREKDEVGESEIQMVEKVAVDCLTLRNIRLLGFMARRGRKVTTLETANALLVGSSSARLWLEDLRLVGTIEYSSVGDNVRWWGLRELELAKRLWRVEK